MDHFWKIIKMNQMKSFLAVSEDRDGLSLTVGRQVWGRIMTMDTY